MRNDVTIVSALFNIERERMDGRDWDEYLKWFDVTLQLKCPMVLFITEDIKELVEEKRKGLPTEIIVQSVDLFTNNSIFYFFAHLYLALGS